MSLIKTPQQISSMREAGKILAFILHKISLEVKPGVVALDLEKLFMKMCVEYKVKSACKGYTAEGLMLPFPTGLCMSINSQSVHCYPKEGVVLKEGDLVTVDTVIFYQGIYVDASFAKGVGNVDSKTQKLLDTSKGALEATVALVKPGVKIGLLSHTMQRFVESAGYNVLQDFAGHGIGTHMHEFPEIPCYGDPSEGMNLVPGMTICIESLVCEGKSDVFEFDGWETKMKDNKRYLQFENTVLVTQTGYEILTPIKV